MVTCSDEAAEAERKRKKQQMKRKRKATANASAGKSSLADAFAKSGSCEGSSGRSEKKQRIKGEKKAPYVPTRHAMETNRVELLLDVSWLGTDFCGWQMQGDGEGEENPSLHEVLSKAVMKVTGEAKLDPAGRTDKGVHAMRQAVQASFSNGVPNDGNLIGLVQVKD